MYLWQDRTDEEKPAQNKKTIAQNKNHWSKSEREESPNVIYPTKSRINLKFYKYPLQLKSKFEEEFRSHLHSIHFNLYIFSS